MTEHEFGGRWTEEKLAAIGDYLTQYRLIFTRNKWARRYKTIYIDAFAGTGDRAERRSSGHASQLTLADIEDTARIKAGSARIALSLESPFHEYIFIEKKRTHADRLREMINSDFPSLAARCKVYDGNAIDVLHDLTVFNPKRWETSRAVAFLDPYGMAVDWATIERIAATQAIDLWLLVSLSGGMRLLTRDRQPPRAFANKLTAFFGTDAWRTEFYRPNDQGTLFEYPQGDVKVATFDSIERFTLDRLRTVFAGVAPHGKQLINSRGSPLFLLCFAAANKRGAPTAIKIADHLLKN
jgi:three-Cys-motif partner protein